MIISIVINIYAYLRVYRSDESISSWPFFLSRTFFLVSREKQQVYRFIHKFETDVLNKYYHRVTNSYSFHLKNVFSIYEPTIYVGRYSIIISTKPSIQDMYEYIL